MAYSKFQMVRDLLLNSLDSYGEKLVRNLSDENIEQNRHEFISRFETEKEKIGNTKYGLSLTDFSFFKLCFDMLDFMKADCIALKHAALVKQQEPFKALKLPDNLSESVTMKWARKVGWTYFEASLLSVGIEPNPITIYEFSKEEVFFSFLECQFYTDAIERLELLREHSEDYRLKVCRPTDYIDWFSQMRFSVPSQLASSVALIHGDETIAKTVDEPEAILQTSERNTLLRLVAAMAVSGYRFDPDAKRNEATSDIVSDLSLLGVSLDPKTVLKWLRIACAELPKDDPES